MLHNTDNIKITSVQIPQLAAVEKVLDYEFNNRILTVMSLSRFTLKQRKNRFIRGLWAIKTTESIQPTLEIKLSELHVAFFAYEYESSFLHCWE